MTRGDLGIIGAVVALVIGSLLLAAAPLSSTSEVVIEGPYGVTHLSLAQDARYVVQGELGEVTFTVEDGVMRCVASPCPDQLCVHAGSLAPGRPIVCAPNRVIARFAGSARGELDAVSR